MDVFPRMVADLPGPIHSLTSRRRGWGRHNSWAPRWGLSSEEGCHSLPQNRIPPSPPLEECEEGRGAGPAGNAQLGPGDTAGREGGVTPAGHQELGGVASFHIVIKGIGIREGAGILGPEKNSQGAVSSAQVPGIVLKRPPWELSSAAPAPPALDSDPPQTQAGPSDQCPADPAGSAGALRGSWPLGVRVGAGLRSVTGGV